MQNSELLRQIKKGVLTGLHSFQKWSKSRWQNFRRQSSIKIVGISVLLIGFLTLVATVSLVLMVRSGVFGPIPTYAALSNIQNHQASEVYDHQGILLGRYYIENRVNADSTELPQHLVNALVATEDARFFEHDGIDFRSLVRVLVKSILLSDESSGGGSTISQQLAKNLYPRRTYAYGSIVINKLREMLIARRLEKIYSKDRILRLYLNTVPFGGNAFGIKIAAQRYFSKELEALNVAEGALLVGMLKATSYYDPVQYPERSIERRNVVLAQMVKMQYLTREEWDEWMQTDLDLRYQPESHNVGLATYFREHLRQDLNSLLDGLKKKDGTAYNLYTDGLRIHTSLDATMQRYAEEAVREHMHTLQKVFLEEWQGRTPWAGKEIMRRQWESSDRYRELQRAGLSDAEIEEFAETEVPMEVFDWQTGSKEITISPLDSIRYYLSLLHAGLLATEVESGWVRAWVGGGDHRFVQFDHVKSRRQIGSVIKPLVYAAALESGMHPCAYIENKLVRYVDYEDWTPENSDGTYGGYYSLEGALSQSVNTVAVDVALQTGVDAVAVLAEEMGLPAPVSRQPSMALGAVEASLRDIVPVYAALVNAGERVEPQYLVRIETSSGEVLYQHGKTESKQVVEEESALVLTQMLQSVVDSGTARRLRYHHGIRGPVAGKTGTTQNQSDGWFIGSTPRLTTGVWVGAESPTVHFRSIHTGQGANTALPIWGIFMKKVQSNKRTSAWVQGSFRPPADSVLLAMDCPHYLPELPMMMDSTDFASLLEFSQGVKGIQPETLDDLMERAPRQRTESMSEYSQRIREHNQKVLNKRARKKKRKAFFDNLFGRKND